MEKTIQEFSGARVLHIYGGSEAEPIATTNAKEALKRSQEKGYFQVYDNERNRLTESIL